MSYISANPKKKAPAIIDGATAKMLIRLFDACYHQGVNDAYESEDYGLCMEHMADTSQPGVFGLLADNGYNDWLLWQIQLMKIAYNIGIRTPFTKFCRKMGKFGSNSLSVMLNVAQDFYNRGLKDYVEHPEAWEIDEFNSKSRVKWSSKGRKTDTQRLVSEAQEFAYRRCKSDSVSQSKFGLSDFKYRTFIRAIGLAGVSNF